MIGAAKKGLWILLTVGLLLGLGMRLHVLHERMGLRDRQIGEKSASARGDGLTEDAALFYDLQRTGLIRPFPHDFRLHLAPPDLILIERAKNEVNPESSLFEEEEMAERERLINALYHSAAGHVVRTQVRKWNQTHFFAAIRDNGLSRVEGFHNEWLAYDPNDPKGRLTTGAFVPESYGFISNGRLLPHFSDWVTALSEVDRIEFRKAVRLKKAAKLTVQIIGRPLSVSPKVTVYPRCLNHGAYCSSKRATAFSLTFSLQPGKHELKIVASPVINKEARIGGLKIFREPDGKSYKWRDLPKRSTRFSTSLTLRTSDGVALTDQWGRPTTWCWEQGLVPLVGSSRQDTYSLYGLLTRSSLPSRISLIDLTFESKIQTRCQRILEQRIRKLWPEDLFSRERRAAVVVIDADTGAVLAAAGLPIPPLGVHPWDLAAFAKVYPAKNPFLMRGWQGLDRHNAPGSAFKPVVALSALRALRGQKDLSHFITGWTREEFEKKNNRVGLSLDCVAYDLEAGKCLPPDSPPEKPRRTISNFMGSPFGAAFIKRSASRCAPLNQGSRPIVGLKEAMRDSINVWFAYLALSVDGKRAMEFDKAMKTYREGGAMPSFPDLELVKCSRDLGFGEMPLDLAANIPESITLKRRRFRSGIWEGDVLYAHPGQLDLMDRERGDQLWVLAQSAIGQGMTASPLEMAKIAAAIATGKIPHPFIFRRLGEEELKPPQAKRMQLGERKLGLLRESMKTVSDTGTARRAFVNHPQLCRIYSKTGTANVGVRKRNGIVLEKRFFTTWFIGWREPKEGKRRLAFACMVSHSHGKGSNTGARVCAPIIAEILEGI